MKLKAEIELGKRTAAMPKAVNQHDLPSHSVGEQTKTQALSEMGISSQKASSYERMARHEGYVKQYIDRKLALNQTPTRQLRRNLPDCVDAFGEFLGANDGRMIHTDLSGEDFIGACGAFAVQVRNLRI